ncbi:MAG TPA: VOC family protein [Thermomicrobiales bacterium]|nr:VOC family protein [Thermomicrobiales bacterium]
MTIRRIVPNLQGVPAAGSREFYVDFLGLEQVMDLGWITTFAVPGAPLAQISVITEDATAPLLADISIEVDDADAYHAAAVRAGLEILYGPADEPWGVRRFFVRDPHGKVLNIVAHREG